MIGNWIDLIIIFCLFILLFSGAKKDFLQTIAEIFSFVFGIMIALLTFKVTAGFFVSNFQIPQAYANAIGFFINASISKVGFLLLFLYATKKIRRFTQIKDPMTKKIIGGTVSVLSGVVVFFTLFIATFSLSLPTFVTTEIEASTFGNFVKNNQLGLEKSFSGVFGNILETTVEKLSFLTVETGTDEIVDLKFETMEFSLREDLEEKMLEMVNKERTARGLKALSIDEVAREAARNYGKYLFENGIFSHTDLEGGSPSDRMKNYDTTYTMIGENLAYAPGLEEAHDGLMESEGHRENILHPFFGRVGIGVIDAGSYGIIFVQEFLD
ncbi:MAG: CvpA family protein [Candidatus Pacebacteria bacterium]|nr:CvpA family protein [Candidatus Paceibacterota bacterium]